MRTWDESEINKHKGLGIVQQDNGTLTHPRAALNGHPTMALAATATIDTCIRTNNSDSVKRNIKVLNRTAVDYAKKEKNTNSSTK